MYRFQWLSLTHVSFGPTLPLVSRTPLYDGFCWFLTINLISTRLHTLFSPVREASPGKNAIFSSIHLPHLHLLFPCSYWALTCCAALPTEACLMWFLFVRPEVCRQLPSDSTSRWTPLLLAMCLPLQGRTRDFHPLDCAHAGRTQKNRSQDWDRFNYFFYLYDNVLVGKICLSPLHSLSLFPNSDRSG